MTKPNKKTEQAKRLKENEAERLRNGPQIPPTVNGFLTNIPTVCKSRNNEMERAIRHVQEVAQAVNGKVADAALIHRPMNPSTSQSFFPVIDGKNSKDKKKT